MPWNLSQRDGKWCVVKQGESDPVPGGCHASRTDAIKHQRALYASESRMASMYAELDEQPEEVLPEPPVKEEPKPSELVKIEIGKDSEALTASLLERMDAMSQRESETQKALVAALQQIGLREPVVNVEAPNVNVEQPAITVEQPEITVHPPEVTIQAPEVTVNNEYVMPETTTNAKTVTFVRDPLTQRVESAEITE